MTTTMRASRLRGITSAPHFPDAACREHEVALFFDDAPDSVRAAKRVCAACPVMLPCRLYALVYEDYGTWGGLSARERASWRSSGRAAV